MARRRFLLLWCALTAILLARVRPCRGWIPRLSSCHSKRAGCLATQELVPARGPLSVQRQAVTSEELQPARFRWASESGWHRAWRIPKLRHGEQYDASNMTRAWWRANIRHQNSKIDVICKKCGHRSKSTWLDSLQGGQAPGCFCNGGVPWSSREGHARCLSMLKLRHGEQYDASNMTWAWWKANIKHQTSKIDVTCRKCGHRSRSTWLDSLRKGQAPGCFCNGGVRWSSREGHARCLSMLKLRHGEQYDASNMTRAWWRASIKHQTSKIDVTCKKCGYRSKSTSLNNLQGGQAPGCFCNGGVPWSSREGHARCLSMLKLRHGEQYDASNMTWAWWKANIKHQNSKIDVICKKCGHRSKSTWLDSLRKGQAPGCFCNGGVRWSSREGHARCLSMLKLRHGEQYDASNMTRAWWRANIKHQNSKIDVTCKKCGYRSRSTSLNSLQSGHAPGCLCSRKTEAKLRCWLCANYPDCTITSQAKGCTNPGTQRPLPFDFGLYHDCHDTIFIELDGEIGHFGRGWGGVADDGGVPQRDFYKEYWAIQHGKVVVRLLQTDVYEDSWPWEDFLTAAIQHATCLAKPCVLTQDAMNYKGGIYRQLRRDLDCKRGHFLPSGIPYLGYGFVRAQPGQSHPGARSQSRLDAS